MLSDKLHIRRLPFYKTPLREPVTNLGRIVDEAGELTQIANGALIRFVAYIEFSAHGIARANHYHHARIEWLYLINGRLAARFVDIDTGETVDHDLEAGDLVQIKPRCAHGFRALEPVQAIELADFPYDHADSFPYLLL